jgi:uncharacterized protein YdhG (YjbR/CyaY superfamily)
MPHSAAEPLKASWRHDAIPGRERCRFSTRRFASGRRRSEKRIRRRVDDPAFPNARPLRTLRIPPYVMVMEDDRKLAAPPGKNHESLFALVSPAERQRLEAIQAIVEQKVSGAERCVSYGMPAFRKKKIFCYFASFKNHIGIYPPVTEPGPLVDELGPHRGPKGNLIFPHSEPLPMELIGRVAEALAGQYSSGTSR